MSGDTSDVIGGGYTTAVFGGTFDPPHQGHIAVIRYILQEVRPRHLVLAVTAQNPFKARRPTPHATRYCMLTQVLRFEGLAPTEDPFDSGIFVSSYGYEFTWQFVDYWRTRFDARLAWVIGEDLRTEVTSWSRWKEMQLPLIIVPEVPGYRSTRVRQGGLDPHPALRDYIATQGLYRTH